MAWDYLSWLPVGSLLWTAVMEWNQSAFSVRQFVTSLTKQLQLCNPGQHLRCSWHPPSMCCIGIFQWHLWGCCPGHVPSFQCLRHKCHTHSDTIKFFDDKSTLKYPPTLSCSLLNFHRRRGPRRHEVVITPLIYHLGGQTHVCQWAVKSQLEAPFSADTIHGPLKVTGSLYPLAQMLLLASCYLWRVFKSFLALIKKPCKGECSISCMQLGGCNKRIGDVSL